MCNECLTPKTAFRPISIQVQFPNHQCQTQAGSHRLQCQHGHNCSQTINAKPMDTISSSRSFRQVTNYFLTVIKADYFPTNVFGVFYVTS